MQVETEGFDAKQQDNQVKIIQAFSLVDLLKEVREATLEGYDFDFNTVEYFPQQFGLHFHVPMVKGGVKLSDMQDSSENSTVQEERTEDSDEQEQEAPKRGRKKGA